MKKTLFFLMGSILLVSCEKDPVQNFSTAELLCKQAWVLTSAGFDDNQDGKIDDAENTITDCQKENLYQFNLNRTGAIVDAGVVCTPPVSTDYSWKLLNTDQKLEINLQPYSILKLNKEEMMIAADQPGLVSNFILTFYR